MLFICYSIYGFLNKPLRSKYDQFFETWNFYYKVVLNAAYWCSFCFQIKWRNEIENNIRDWNGTRNNSLHLCRITRPATFSFVLPFAVSITFYFRHCLLNYKSQEDISIHTQYKLFKIIFLSNSFVFLRTFFVKLIF